jgi:NADH-quinone oxidoreductase subunit G
VLPAAAYTERDGSTTSAERRVQRFYPALPAKTGTKADFSITAAIAQACGLALEGRSALLVMNKIAAAENSFAGVTYNLLAEVSEQWPAVGRGEMYYGGTSYENTQGLGAHLALASAPDVSASGNKATRVRPSEETLIAVPVSKLYDMGTTVSPSVMLKSHIGEASVSVNPATAAKLGLTNAGTAVLKLNGLEAAVKVRFDESISGSVVLVYRSFGLPIDEPGTVELLPGKTNSDDVKA